MKHRFHIRYKIPGDENTYEVDYSKTFWQNHEKRIGETLTDVFGKPMTAWDCCIIEFRKIY